MAERFTGSRNYKRSCVYCRSIGVTTNSGRTVETQWKCEQCAVALCIGKRNCFTLFHENLTKNSQEWNDIVDNDIKWLKINKTVKNINSQKTCWRNKGYIIQIIETFWESFGLFWRLFVRLNKCFLYKWFVSLTIGFYSVFF